MSAGLAGEPQVAAGPRPSSGLLLFGPVRPGNAFEETVERLLAVIKLGVASPGERLPPERELAASLNISRLTLREAIAALRHEGYLESRRGRFGGTFICRVPPRPQPGELRREIRENGSQLADALTFRLAVETGAAQVLARQFAPEAKDSAGAAGQSARAVLCARLAELNAAEPADYRRLDTLFHLSIAELTGSSLLAAACADARMRLNDLLNAIPVLRRNIEHTAGQHAAIAGAILAGDPDRAGRAVAEHLEGTAALLRGFLG
jgi:DNA-binding FadR family transcriptional regulator